MNEHDPMSDVVVSWEYKDDKPIALSHFNDAVWIAPAEGALAAIPERSRQLDTTRYPLDMRIQMKRALYCFLRHPIRSATDVNLATLIKRHQALLALTAFMKREGLTALSAPNARKFLLEETKRFKHIESVTSTVATLKGLAIYCERGYVKLEVSLSYPFKHGAKAIAQALWRDAHGSDTWSRKMVVQAISAQAKIKLQIARHMRGSDSPSVATDYLFVRLGRQKKEKTDEGGATERR